MRTRRRIATAERTKKPKEEAADGTLPKNKTDKNRTRRAKISGVANPQTSPRLRYPSFVRHRSNLPAATFHSRFKTAQRETEKQLHSVKHWRNKLPHQLFTTRPSFSPRSTVPGTINRCIPHPSLEISTCNKKRRLLRNTSCHLPPSFL